MAQAIAGCANGLAAQAQETLVGAKVTVRGRSSGRCGYRADEHAGRSCCSPGSCSSWPSRCHCGDPGRGPELFPGEGERGPQPRDGADARHGRGPAVRTSGTDDQQPEQGHRGRAACPAGNAAVCAQVLGDQHPMVSVSGLPDLAYSPGRGSVTRSLRWSPGMGGSWRNSSTSARAGCCRGHAARRLRHCWRRWPTRIVSLTRSWPGSTSAPSTVASTHRWRRCLSTTASSYGTPEGGGRIDCQAEDHEQMMLALGLQSKREITRTRIRIRTRGP